MVRLLSTLIVLFISLSAFAQAPVGSMDLNVRFLPTMNDAPLVLNGGGASASSPRLYVTMLRCYITGIALWQDGKAVWREAGSYHLLDAENPESLTLQLHPPAGLRYDALHFNLGVDSIASTSGAHGGDLDPVKGMYWAWQSGYINFKLEGVSPVCLTRKHEFHFHLGGYQYPYAAIQLISLRAMPATELLVRMDLEKFFAAIDIEKTNSIMIPGEEAAEFSRKLATIFKIQ